MNEALLPQPGGFEAPRFLGPRRKPGHRKLGARLCRASGSGDNR
jgi:hypothetical protein